MVPRKTKRTLQRRVFGLFVACLACALAVSPSSAHQPWFNSAGSPDPANPFRLPSDVGISQVVFGGLWNPEAVDYYVFDAPDDFDLGLHLVVADAPACAAFQPALVLTGPGLPIVSDANPVPVPTVATPEAGDGMIVLSGADWSSSSDGGFRFVTGPKLSQRLAGGEYRVAVFDPAGGVGSYGLTLDGREDVSLTEDFAANFAAWSECAPPAPA